MKKSSPPTNNQPTGAPVVHQEIRAESFVLVDSAGRTRATLGVMVDGLGNDDTLLMMYDAQGRFRLSLRAGAYESTINIFGDPKRKDDGHTIDLLRAGWERPGQMPLITVWNREDGDRQVVARYVAPDEDDDGDESDATS